MEYYEVQVLFEEEVSTKSGIKLRKVRRNYPVEAQSVTASEVHTSGSQIVLSFIRSGLIKKIKNS